MIRFWRWARLRTSVTLAVVVAVVGSVVALAVASSAGPFGDPNESQAEHDPDAGYSRIDPSSYLELRERYLATRFGLDSPGAGRRAEAAEQRERQERERDDRERRDQGATPSAQPASAQPATSPASSDPGATTATATAAAVSGSTPWTPVGPAPIPNGQPIRNSGSASIAVSGRVTSIAVHPTNPDIVYAGTAQGGVYRTTDGGTTWTPIFDGAVSQAIGSVAIAPSQPSTVYVGTGEANLSGDSYAATGVYRIDQADSTPILTGPLNPGGIFTLRSISRVAVKADDPGTIFVATDSGRAGRGGRAAPAVGTQPRGLFRSTNAASADPATVAFTKLTVTGPDEAASDVALDPADANSLVVFLRGLGAYRTTNALADAPAFSQTLTSGGRGLLDLRRIGSTVNVIAGTEDDTGSLFKSADGGATWSSALAGAHGYCNGQCWYDLPVAMDPTNANTIYVGGSAEYNGGGAAVLKKSTDGGKTFAAHDIDMLHPDSHAIAVASSAPSAIYTGSDGGMFKSTDGGITWSSLNNATFSATQFTSIATHPTDRNFTIGGAQDNGTSWMKPDGTTWRQIREGDGGYTAIDQNATDTTNVVEYHTYYNATDTQIMYERRDSVTGTWQPFGCYGGAAHNGIHCSDRVLFYAPLALGPGSPNTVYFGTDRLYRSADKGKTNSVVSQAPLDANAVISAVAVSPQSDGVRLVGLSNGRVFMTGSGNSRLVEVTPAANTTFVSQVAIDPTNKNVAYVAVGGYLGAGNEARHLFKTTNLTTGSPPTWTAVGTGLPDVPADSVVVDPANPANVFVGTDIGVYFSTDGGQSWGPFGSGMPVVAVFDLEIAKPGTGGEILRAATYGRGLYDAAIGSGVEPSPTPTGAAIAISDASVTEGNCCSKTMKFTLTLSKAMSSAVTVNYATADGTATAGKDYVAKSGTLKFAAGVTTKTLSVTITGDKLAEGNETFFVNLSSPVGATIADGQGVGTIVDND